MLARRDFSQHELQQKLKEQGYGEEAITATLLDLRESGHLNDQRLTENLIYYRRQRGYGPERIRTELQQRGITEEMIAEQLQITDNAWLVEVHKVWQKHFKGHTAKDFKTKAKQMRFLQYRGFTLEQIESVLDPYDH